MISKTYRRCLMVTVFMVAMILLSAHVSAEQLTIGVPAGGTLAPTNTAEYTLNLPAPGQLNISLEGWLSTYNWALDIDRLYLYNDTGDPVGWSSFGSEEDPYLSHMMEGDEAIPINIGKGGIYTLRLHSGEKYQWPEAVSMQSYSITASFTEVDDIHEPNESMADATPITLDSPVTAYQWRRTPTTAVHDDEDVYAVTLPSPGILTIALSNWISTLNWGVNYDRMYLYTADGSMFDDSGNEEMFDWMMGENGETTAQLSSGGTYYIRLHSGNGTNLQPYTLLCTFTAVHDIYEPNDDLATATYLPSGKEVTAYQWKSLSQGISIDDDEDWYTFRVAVDGTTTVTMDGWLSTYNWGVNYDILYLYRLTGDNEYEEVIRDNMIGDPFTGTYDLTAGDYALRLHSGRGTSTTPYTLRVDYPGPIMGIETGGPMTFSLERPYPNPFNPSTTIEFTLPEEGYVELSIYNAAGQKIRDLVSEHMAAGRHSMVWDGRSDNGQPVSSGIYISRVKMGEKVSSRQMTLVK